MSAIHALPQPMPQPPSTAIAIMTAEQAERAERRALVREFLRSVPASEPDAALDLQAPDGSALRLTRGALTARIAWLRPRMRRIIERQVIGHRSREQTAEELSISMKTLERDQQEALDLLISDASETISKDA